MILQRVNETDEGSALVDIGFEPGQFLKARVIGINDMKGAKSKRRKKYLKLSLIDNPEVLFHFHTCAFCFETFKSNVVLLCSLYYRQ